VRRFLSTLGSVLLPTFTAASAQALPVITLEGCESLSLEALRKHLSLELSTLGLPGALPGLTLRCRGSEALIVITAEPSQTSPSPTRVELADTAPGARERLVALAATELLAQWDRSPAPTKESQPSKPAVPSPPPEIRSETHSARPARPRRLELSAAGTAATLGSPRAILGGAALGARVPFGSRWSLWLDSRWERGKDALPLADVRWSLGSAFVGVGATARVGVLELSSGLGARAGWLSLSASAVSPNRGQSLTAPWLGAALPLRALVRAGAVVQPFVGVEVGYVALPVRGLTSDGQSLVEHDGVWLSASLGMAFVL
jgi:hypothetical protein